MCADPHVVTQSFLVLMVQNLFTKSHHMRDVNLSANYIILHKNPRDATQIFSLGRQLRPSKGSDLIKIFQEATKEPYSHLQVLTECNQVSHTDVPLPIFSD